MGSNNYKDILGKTPHFHKDKDGWGTDPEDGKIIGDILRGLGDMISTIIGAKKKQKQIKSFFGEDGVIGDAERRLLERKRQKYCVSEERAKLIEESCAPSLSEEEKEYIEIYKDMLEDGEISERRRKILNKEAESLGISHSRVNELEEMV